MPIFIELPEAERTQLLIESKKVFTAAIAFAEDCCDILVGQYGARRDEIKSQIVFEYAAIGRIARGEGLLAPNDAVRDAILRFKPTALGLTSVPAHSPTPLVASDTAHRRAAEYR